MDSEGKYGGRGLSMIDQQQAYFRQTIVKIILLSTHHTHHQQHFRNTLHQYYCGTAPKQTRKYDRATSMMLLLYISTCNPQMQLIMGGGGGGKIHITIYM